jgi:hypothetical protein
LKTTTPIQTETTITSAVSELKTTVIPPTTTNDQLPNNIPVFRMYFLAAVIGIAVFLIATTATFLWLRHRDLIKKGGRLN